MFIEAIISFWSSTIPNLFFRSNFTFRVTLPGQNDQLPSKVNEFSVLFLKKKKIYFIFFLQMSPCLAVPWNK